MPAKTRTVPKNTKVITWVRIIFKNGEYQELGCEYFFLTEEKRIFVLVNHYDQDACAIRETTTYVPFENVHTTSTQEIRVVIA